MTTLTPELVQLRRTVRTQSIGCFWAALVFFLLARWLGAKFPERSGLSLALWLLCAANLGMAILLLVESLRSTGTMDRLTKLKEFVGLALAVGGAIVLLLGAWLFVAEHRDAFGEAGALCLLGLIGIGVGWNQRQRQAAGSLQGWLMEQLVAGRQRIGPIAIGVGIVCVIIGASATPAVLNVFRRGLDADFPEWGALVWLGFILVSAGLWLFLSEKVNASSARILVLIVGGLVGLDIALMAAGRAWLWKDDVFFRGISEWRGPEGWRIWLCAYLGLFGLALMFGSFYLARTDIRVNPIVRRVLYGYNAVFSGLLLLAFLVCLNIVVYAAYPLTFDWSETRGLYTLSPQTLTILERLKKDVTVYSLMSPRTRIYKDLQVLLDNCQAVTSKFQVVTLSPDQNFADMIRLAERYPEIRPDSRGGPEEQVGRGLLVVYGPEEKSEKGKTPPHAFIRADKLFDVKRSDRGAPTYVFMGEKVLMTELLFLMEGQQKSKIYFLQGDGEISLKELAAPRRRPFLPLSQTGMGIFIDRLKKENYDVQGLTFGAGKDDAMMRYVNPSGKDSRADVPGAPDKTIVAIIGASQPIPKETLDALSRFMDRGGRLVVMTDILTDRQLETMSHTGLEGFLKKYNVDVTNDFVLRYSKVRGDIPDIVYSMTSRKNDTLLARKFTEIFPFWSARLIKPSTQSPSFKAEPLLEVVPGITIIQGHFWAESDLSALGNPLLFVVQHPEKKAQETLPVAVTVTETGGRPRLAVFGDAEWVSDYFMLERNLRIFGFDSDQSFSLLVSTFDWLTDRPGVGARPKDASFYNLGQNIERGRMILLPVWLMIVVVVCLGLGTWLVRRK